MENNITALTIYEPKALMLIENEKVYTGENKSRIAKIKESIKNLLSEVNNAKVELANSIAKINQNRNDLKENNQFEETTGFVLKQLDPTEFNFNNEEPEYVIQKVSDLMQKEEQLKIYQDRVRKLKLPIHAIDKIKKVYNSELLKPVSRTINENISSHGLENKVALAKEELEYKKENFNIENLNKEALKINLQKGKIFTLDKMLSISKFKDKIITVLSNKAKDIYNKSVGLEAAELDKQISGLRQEIKKDKRELYDLGIGQSEIDNISEYVKWQEEKKQAEKENESNPVNTKEYPDEDIDITDFSQLEEDNDEIAITDFSQLEENPEKIDDFTSLNLDEAKESVNQIEPITVGTDFKNELSTNEESNDKVSNIEEKNPKTKFSLSNEQLLEQINDLRFEGNLKDMRIKQLQEADRQKKLEIEELKKQVAELQKNNISELEKMVSDLIKLNTGILGQLQQNKTINNISTITSDNFDNVSTR